MRSRASQSPVDSADTTAGTDARRNSSRTDIYGKKHAARLLSTGSDNVCTRSAIPEDTHPLAEAEQASELEALVSNFLENRTYPREHARAALVNKEGIARVEGDQRRDISPPVIVIVTNARVIFVTPDDDLDLDEGLLDYGELVDITVDEDRPNLIKLTTEESVVWRCLLPNADPDVLAAVKNHLGWIGGLRRQIKALESEVESTADTIREYADGMEWEAARAAYDRVRDKLDRLVSALQITNTVADHVLAPELTDIERALEEGHVRMYIEQARSKLELARHLVEREESDSAADVLRETRDLHQTARDQSEAVRRGDSFQFGRQRDLEDDLQRLGWEIESVAAEPIRQANDAVVRAEETGDLATAIEHREIALDRYDRILDVGWLDIDPDAGDDAEEIRTKRAETIERLVDLHAEIASERWNQAVYRQRASDMGAALERIHTTVTHIERARELVERFDRGHIDLSVKLDWMPEALDDEDPYATRHRARRSQQQRTSTDWGADTDQEEPTTDETSTTADGGDASTDEEKPALDEEIPSLDDGEIPTVDDQDADDSDDQQGGTDHENGETEDVDLNLSLDDEQTPAQTESTNQKSESADTEGAPASGETAHEERDDETQSSTEGSPAARITEELLDTGGSDSLTWLERGTDDEETDENAADGHADEETGNGQSGQETDGGPPRASSVRALAETDTHHEITLDLDGLSVSEDVTETNAHDRGQSRGHGSPEIPEGVDSE